MKRSSITALGFAFAAVLAVSNVSAAQTQSTPSGGKSELLTTQVDHTKAMEGLLVAAQKLRESIQAMAQQPAGQKRSAAMESARDALLTTQRAMLDLPAEMRVDSVDIKKATDWPKAAQRLQQAADKLDDAIKAMSKQPAGKGRSEAIATARKALEQTQHAMLSLPEYRVSQ